MPKLGIDDSRPALARSRPRSLCNVGMRNAAPLMNTLANSVAVSAIASIDQRRAVPIAISDIGPSFHSDLIMLNRHLIQWDALPGVVAGAAVVAGGPALRRGGL